MSPGNRRFFGWTARQYVLRTSSSLGESITQRSFRPLPSSTQMAVDRRWRQADRFGDTQAGRVADGQDGAMLPAVDGVEEPGDLVLAEHGRKLLRLATGGDDLVDAPNPPQGDLLEKADGGHPHKNLNGP